MWHIDNQINLHVHATLIKIKNNKKKIKIEVLIRVCFYSAVAFNYLIAVTRQLVIYTVSQQHQCARCSRVFTCPPIV